MHPTTEKRHNRLLAVGSGGDVSPAALTPVSVGFITRGLHTLTTATCLPSHQLGFFVIYVMLIETKKHSKISIL